MINKKGFLLAEETLKIIIAVIAIGFLIYFLTSIYLKSQESEKLELAKASLEHLISEINLERDEIEIYNPSGWIIISFPIGQAKPNYCNNLNWENCLCICNEAWNTIRDSGLATDCDNSGICMKSDLKVENEKIKITNPPIKLNIDIEDKIIK